MGGRASNSSPKYSTKVAGTRPSSPGCCFLIIWIQPVGTMGDPPQRHGSGTRRRSPSLTDICPGAWALKSNLTLYNTAFCIRAKKTCYCQEHQIAGRGNPRMLKPFQLSEFCTCPLVAGFMFSCLLKTLKNISP